MREPASWPFGPVGLGCGSFGGIGSVPDLIGRGLDADAACATLDEAVALGITLFDTAAGYAGGASETTIGRWLAQRDLSTTADVRIATKVAPAWVSGGDERFDTAFIAAAFERSLERLGVNGVELLMIHGPDDSTPVEDTIEAVESIRASGRALRLGACNLDAAQLLTALDASEKLGVAGYEVIQNGYHLLFVDEDREVQAICAERGLAYTAYSPLAGGALTGKYRPGQPAPEGTRLALRPHGYDALLTPAVHEAIDRLRLAAAERGLSCGALALAWLLHDHAVAALITGPARNAPHLGLATEALRFDMDPDLHAEIGDWFRSALRG
ncbi:MAG: aldo/keto reductase [Acidimicrobiia bacterium]